ncbi:hypothetical protein M6D81_16725 [Paenibacillus sp. J5C_2022]|uniref:hypothetical protein n=1 Tax=Paenibacillus sp. J5C2022 TaxID=2977129 RepID=UPI0021D0C420|nr:hypothetical protein [Paenibacillus sp. J5C2022]MCU6710346.1 hypothetical protein [Paenibacillus sp. J5C2022]
MSVGMEAIALKSIAISYDGNASRIIPFQSAELITVTQYGDKLWYIDISGVSDEELLQWFSQSEDIGVGVIATAEGGSVYRGEGYLHPNEPNKAAAIRGNGKLLEG